MIKTIKLQKRLLGRALLAVMILWLLAGCTAAKNMGRYQGSLEVRKIFETHQVVPNHNYYYTGSNVDPAAIIAVDNSYTLTSADLWTQAAVDKKQLKFWVETMTKIFADMPRGFYMLDSSGRRFGMYYSARGRGPIEMEGEKRVSVYLPDEKSENYRGPRLR